MANKLNKNISYLSEKITTNPFDSKFNEYLKNTKNTVTSLMKKNGKSEEKYQKLFELGSLYIKSLNFENATEIFKQQLEVVASSKSSFTQNHEITSRLSGSGNKGFEILTPVFELIGNEQPQMKLLVSYNIGLCQFFSGFNKDALKTWTKCYKESKNWCLPPLRWKLLRAICMVCWMLGNYSDCLGYLSILRFLTENDKTNIECIETGTLGQIPQASKLDNFDSKNTERV